MRQERIVKHAPSDSRHEHFRRARQPGHWYAASTDFSLKHLKPSGEVLVIGSPLFEAMELRDAGWRVTYLDVREPPQVAGIAFMNGDATAIPFPDDSFDAVSSSCVMTHAGLGRYGDAKMPNGDEVMLKEVARVLKPDCLAAITFGAVVDQELPIRMGNFHRIYTLEDARGVIRKSGLLMDTYEIWSVQHKKWVDNPTADELDPDYLSVLLRKCG